MRRKQSTKKNYSYPMIVTVLLLVFILGIAAQSYGGEVTTTITNQDDIPPSLSTADEIVSKTTNIKEGEIRYHYHSSFLAFSSTTKSACDNVVLIGVGFAMTVTSYDHVSTQIVSASAPSSTTTSNNNNNISWALQQSVMVIVIDHNPGDLEKSNAMKYAKLVNILRVSLEDIIPACSAATHSPPQNATRLKSTNKRKWIIGGHSLSGQASIQSIPYLDTPLPDGYIGLDPFRADLPHLDISIPSLHWGLARTTCGAFTTMAAMAAYKISNVNYRVLFQIQNNDRRGGVHTTDNSLIVTKAFLQSCNKITHCIFTDHGCGGSICPSNPQQSQWILPVIGQSVRVLIDAINNNEGKFVREDFDAIIPNDYKKRIKVFMNYDEVVVDDGQVTSIIQDKGILRKRSEIEYRAD